MLDTRCRIPDVRRREVRGYRVSSTGYRVRNAREIGNHNVIPEFADLSAIALAKADGEYPGSLKSDHFKWIPA
ncbi:MAG: hypothetical protein P9L88_00185 [Candidatus Tantalella remota]|nr:hypothetical protein [Candidatus Tantalella remota]